MAHAAPEKYVCFAGGYGCLADGTRVTVNTPSASRKMFIEEFHKYFNSSRRVSEVKTRGIVESGVGLVTVEAVLYSGEKDCVRVTHENGDLTITADHVVYTINGEAKVSSLVPGDELIFDSGRPAGTVESMNNDEYVCGLPYHPYAHRYGKKKTRIELHRFIYEAVMNGYTPEAYKQLFRKRPPEGLVYINRHHVVHHKDGNHANNDFTNLQLMSDKAHKRLHADQRHTGVSALKASKVISIEPVGKRRTYDLITKEYPRTFVANGLVVHNCGKTFWGVSSGIIQMAQFPRSRGVVVRKTLPRLKETTMRFFLEACPQELVQDFNKTDRRLTSIHNSTVLFCSADDKKKFESDQIDWFLLDEADEIDEEIFDVLASRLRNPYVDSAYYRGMVVTNPTSRHHWIYKRFTSSNPDFKLFCAPTKENEANLPANYITGLTSRMSPEMAKRFVDGQFSFELVGVPVYHPDFVPSIHCGDFQWNKEMAVVRGWDFGFHRPACVWLQVDQDYRIRVLHELLGKDEPIHQFATRVMAESQRVFPDCMAWQDFCDPAGNQKTDKGEETSVDIVRDIIGHPPSFRRTLILEGVDLIRDRLRTLIGGKPLIQIDNRCEIIKEGFYGGYHYDEKKPDVICKDGYYEHLMDALRYASIGIGMFGGGDVYEVYAQNQDEEEIGKYNG